MSSHPLFSFYKRLPVWLQSNACWFYGYNFARRTYNKYFYERLGWLLESERWSSSEIEAYQNEQLREVISNAYENVLYYRELMDGMKLQPSDIKTIYDLPKLPILKKEDVRNNFEKFVSKKANKRNLLFQHTSGTTGKSLHFYTNRETDITQWAIWWRHRNRFGMTTDSWHVNFRAQLIVPAEQRKPPYWRWVSPMRQLVINMQHFVPSKIRAIMDFLNQNYFEFYTAYPSIIHILAVTACENGLRLTNPPRVIFMGCENTLDYQKRFLEEFTGAIITDQYGFAEGCANVSQCEAGMYHEDFELGTIECVDSEALSGGRYRGRIAATGFTCPEFPFIRYEVGDIGIWEDSTINCVCGRQSKLMVKVEGREDDYVLTPEGRRIMRFDYIFKDAQNCMESQIVQEEIGKIKVFIVRRSTYTSKDEKYILKEIRKWISELLEVDFVYVTEIARESSGKFRAVKSYLRPAINNKIPESCACSIDVE
jgi:phenylacetate-CoA ligase